MDDKDAVLNEKTELQTQAEYNGKKEGGQPESFDNDACACDVSENVIAAAETDEHEENNVDSCSPSPPASANQLRDNHSSDGSSLPRSVNSQLLATDKAKTEMNSNAEQQQQQQRLKILSNRLFKICYRSISSLAVLLFA